MKKIFVITFLLLQFVIHAQYNSSYIHYMFNGILFNPAYAGSQDALNITTLYRNQWSGINGSPVTLSFGAHTPLKNNKINIGLMIENDRYAIFNNTRAVVAYAYRTRFLSGKLSFGLQGGVNVTRSDWSMIHTHDGVDPNFSGSIENKVLPTAGAGLYYNTQRFYFGFSVPDLYNGTLSTNPVLIWNTGYLFRLSEDFQIKPSVLFKTNNSGSTAFNVAGTFYYKDVIGFGAGYSHLSSYMFFTDIRLNEQLNFGYGFERPNTNIKGYTAGSHEIMVRYLFRYKIKAVNARYF